MANLAIAPATRLIPLTTPDARLYSGDISGAQYPLPSVLLRFWQASTNAGNVMAAGDQVIVTLTPAFFPENYAYQLYRLNFHLVVTGASSGYDPSSDTAWMSQTVTGAPIVTSTQSIMNLRRLSGVGFAAAKVIEYATYPRKFAPFSSSPQTPTITLQTELQDVAGIGAGDLTARVTMEYLGFPVSAARSSMFYVPSRYVATEN